MNLYQLKYPIGEFKISEVDKNKVGEYIKEIERVPDELKSTVNGLNDKQLDTPYRENGWTVRQVIHHIPDSHLNGYVRVKLALTEEEPTIKNYDQDKWVQQIDTFETPISVSLDLLTAVHYRWVVLLKLLTVEQLQRKLNNPELGLISIYETIAQYAWHGKHHVAHITSIKNRMNW